MFIRSGNWIPVALLCLGGTMLTGCQNWRQKNKPYPTSQGFQESPMRQQQGMIPGSQSPVAPPSNPHDSTPPTGSQSLPATGGSTSQYTPGATYPGGTNQQKTGYRNGTPSIPSSVPTGNLQSNQGLPLRQPVGNSSMVTNSPPFGGYPGSNSPRPVSPVPGQYVSPARPVQGMQPISPAPLTNDVNAPAPQFPDMAQPVVPQQIPGTVMPTPVEPTTTAPSGLPSFP